MKGVALMIVVGLGLVLYGIQTTGVAAQQAGGLQSLRGEIPLTEDNPADMVKQQNVKAGSFGRAYRQQPPLIPHRIDKYEIDIKVNQCMNCHDWPKNVAEGAPKISETHYVDRDGIALDHVSRTRWFCNQCHVPQANTQELVGNGFRNATEVK